MYKLEIRKVEEDRVGECPAIAASLPSTEEVLNILWNLNMEPMDVFYLTSRMPREPGGYNILLVGSAEFRLIREQA